MEKKHILFILVIAMTLVGFGQAHAIPTLIGDTVTAEVQFGGTTAQGPLTATVGAGVEFDFGNVDIDIGSTTASYFNILPGQVASDETYLITDIGPDVLIAGLISFAVANMDMGPIISFTPTSLTVTLRSGTQVYANAAVGINMSLQAVPEPATMLLLGAGLAGLAGLRRKFGKP